MTSLVHGLIAGGAAAHLHQWTKEQSKNFATADMWVPLALEVNHLMLLTAETMVLAGSPLGMFGKAVRAASVLAPIAVGASLSQKPVIPFSRENIQHFNTAYRAGVIATSIASGVLGNPLFAVASLGMIATDFISNQQVKAVSLKVNKLMGVLAFVGYSAQIMASKAASAAVAKVSALVVGGKFFLVDFLSKLEGSPQSSETISSDSDNDTSCHCHNSNSRPPTHNSSSGVGSGGSFSSAIGETFCRRSVW